MPETEISETDVLSVLFASLVSLKTSHAPSTETHKLLKKIVRQEIEKRFSSVDEVERPFGPFGDVIFPFFEMGAINSLNLFDLDEILIFSFYWLNRRRYRRTLDLGANLGLHSLIMARCGFDVTCLEPDPRHFAQLQRNLASNAADKVISIEAAVSTEQGETEFIRVLGNTTGSHIAGSKTNVYGDTDRFTVKVLPFAELAVGVDLIKMDIEGHEAVVLCATDADQWAGFDMIAEVGGEENSVRIFDHFEAIGVNLFAQKINWRRVLSVADMPTSYRDGSLFITVKNEMPWGSDEAQ